MRAVLCLIFDLTVLFYRLAKRGGKSALVAELLLCRQQLLALRRKNKRAPKLTSMDRVVFAITSLFISSRRLHKLSISVAHSTLIGLHRALVQRKYSKLFTNRGRKPGPKGPSKELIDLIVGIKTKNPRYGCPKIALLASALMGDDIDEQLVRRILRRHYRPLPGSGGSWLNQIGIAKDALWSMDLFCCESITLQTHWVMMVIDHHTREIIGFAVKSGTMTGEDVSRMFASIRFRSSRSPKYLSTDNDPLFRYHQWRANLNIFDIDEIKSVPETPWSHPFIERAIGTIRRECLDDTLFWNAKGLESQLQEFALYYNEARVHSSISGQTPLGLSGKGRVTKVDLKNYVWQSSCGGRFAVPIAA